LEHIKMIVVISLKSLW